MCWVSLPLYILLVWQKLIRIDMKNLNVLNRIYLAILVLGVLFTIYSIVRQNAWSRYNYTASLTAPTEFPIHVRQSYFITGGEEKVYVADSDVNYGKSFWGDRDISSKQEKQRLPLKLVLSYASYRDKSFYKDTISLPVKLIEALFKNKPAEQPTNSEDEIYIKRDNFDFIVGIANKGNIIIWLRANDQETVLLKYKIKASNPVGNDTYYKKMLTPKEYFKQVFMLDAQQEEQFEKERGKVINYIDTPSGWGAGRKHLNPPASE